jgi:hypothetical protein
MKSRLHKETITERPKPTDDVICQVPKCIRVHGAYRMPMLTPDWGSMNIAATRRKVAVFVASQ